MFILDLFINNSVFTVYDDALYKLYWFREYVKTNFIEFDSSN